MNDQPATSPENDRPADLWLIEQGAVFRRIVDGVPGCILVADANGQIIYANRFAVAILGRPLEELLGSGWLQSLHPTFFKKAHSQWAQCIQRSEPLDVTWLFRQHDGTYRWQHIRAEPTIQAIAQSVSWYVLGIDVDELVKAQESLSASEHEAREILDRVPAMISTRTEEGIAFTNKQMSDYVGVVITDLRDGAYLDYIHPDDREQLVQQNINAPEKIPNDIVYRLRGTDGIYRWFHTRAKPYFNEDGSLYRWYALNSDIDDLYRSKELIQEREFQLNLLIETVPAILWKASPDGNIVYVNGKAAEYTGRSLEKIQRGWIDLFHPDEAKEVLDRWHGLLAGGPGYEFFHRLLGKDGQYRWFHTSIAVVRDDYGKTMAFHGVILDATDRKNAELALQNSEDKLRDLCAKLANASRVAAVAELSASIAHELNQPLTSVLANAQACRRWLSSTRPNLPEALTSIEYIIRDSRAADTRMRSIRSLFKLQPFERKPANMAELIREAVSIIKEDVNKRHIPIEFDFEEAALMVSVDRIQIQQVIINLVTNAIEAMNTTGREPRLRIVSKRIEDHNILTDFVDNGHGLKDTDEIFDAFMTTKSDGMGIGLAISRSIVDAHEGQLWARNNLDHGATFSLLLRSA
jgi:PAS domain S-box-containing protein